MEVRLAVKMSNAIMAIAILIFPLEKINVCVWCYTEKWGTNQFICNKQFK